MLSPRVLSSCVCNNKRAYLYKINVIRKLRTKDIKSFFFKQKPMAHLEDSFHVTHYILHYIMDSLIVTQIAFMLL